MLFELKLRKIGNSVGMILPKKALAPLAIDEGDSVSVTEGPEVRARQKRNGRR